MGRISTLRESSIGMLLLVVACSRTGLELDEVDGLATSGGMGPAGGASTQGGGGSGATGGAPAGGASGSNGTSGAGGSVPEGGTGGTSGISCPSGALTWSCAASVISGPCCDGNGSIYMPHCQDSCPLADNPQGEVCDTPGATIDAPVAAGASRICAGYLFNCWVSTCTCGCRDDEWPGITGLAEACEPLVFSNAHSYPEYVAFDEEFVYWTVHGGACPLSGSGDDRGSGRLVRAHRVNGSQSVDIDELPCPVGVAVAGDDVYITNQPGAAGGSIWTARKNGENVRVFVDGLHSPSSIQADATHVYFSDSDEIYRVGRGEGGEPELVARAEFIDANTINAFVLDDDSVYWIDRGFLEDGGIFRAPKAGGEPELVAFAADALEIAISSEGLFWVDEKRFDEYAVVFLGWDSETPSELAMSAERPFSLSAFEDQAYWVENYDYDDGAVFGVSARTRERIFFAPNVPFAATVNVDRDYVFWTTFRTPESWASFGQVVRACRPGSR